MENNKEVIEAELVDGENIRMKDEPEKLTLRQKLGRGIKRHWKGALFGGLSMAATATGGYLLGRYKGRKIGKMNVPTTEKLDEPEPADLPFTED